MPKDDHTDRPPTFVLVPGAWMGGWIWEDTVARLRSEGHRAETLPLRGLEQEAGEGVSAVTLADHVDDVLALLDGLGPSPVVLVGHSYSGTVVGQVADRRPDTVVASVHVGSFLPRDGRSLLDDWGDDAEGRAAEKQQVLDDGMIWAAPPRNCSKGRSTSPPTSAPGSPSGSSPIPAGPCRTRSSWSDRSPSSASCSCPTPTRTCPRSWTTGLSGGAIRCSVAVTGPCSPARRRCTHSWSPSSATYAAEALASRGMRHPTEGDGPMRTLAIRSFAEAVAGGARAHGVNLQE